MTETLNYLTILQGEDVRLQVQDIVDGEVRDPTGAYIRATCVSSKGTVFDLDTGALGGIEIDSVGKSAYLVLTAAQTAAMVPTRDASMSLWFAYGENDHESTLLIPVQVLRAHAKSRYEAAP